MIRGLVFDFDGLILDTEAPEYQCWREIYAAHGCDLSLDTWAVCIGTADAFNPYAHLEAQLGRPLDLEDLRARRDARFAELLEAEQVLPGVTDYLAAGRRLGLGLGLASSSTREWVVGHLHRLGLLERFDAIRCAGDVDRVKPDPALYRAVLDDLGLAPAEAVAFEDSPNGVLAAKRAGLRCVAVPNALTAGLDLGQADLRLESLAALPLEAVLARLEAAPAA